MNKEYIIRKTSEFKNVMDNKKILKSQYFIIYRKENKINHNRYGLSVSKKIINAVGRNKIKRKIKDILMKEKIKGSTDYVIIVRKKILEIEYSEIKKELLKLIRR